MADPIALANMRNWIITKSDEDKKNHHQWQIQTTFVGIFISAAVGLALFLISKPLAISALIPFGLSLIVPLFIQSIPFSTDAHKILIATQKYENIITDTLFGMIEGIKSIEFMGSVLDQDVKIRLLTDRGLGEISMREDEGEVKFFHNNKLMPLYEQAH